MAGGTFSTCPIVGTPEDADVGAAKWRCGRLRGFILVTDAFFQTADKGHS